MYKKETIKKVVNALNTAVLFYEAKNVSDIKMCISDGNQKIGKVMNVSLPPILACPNCSHCQKLCYDIKACNQYPNTVVDARARNYAILKRNRDEYFNRIEDKIRRRRANKYFRWHVAGDIVDYDYFCRMVEVAKNHPDFIFWTYTKAYGTVNEYVKRNGRDAIPSNFSIMYSEWRGMPMDNPYGFPEFKVVFKDEEEPSGFYCPGNCDVCKAIHRGCLAGETTYCKEH